MQSLRIYTKGWSLRTQLKWASALLVIIGVVVGGVTAYNYFSVSEEEANQAIEEIGFSPKEFLFNQLWISIILVSIGLVVLLATMFAGGQNGNYQGHEIQVVKKMELQETEKPEKKPEEEL